MLRQDTVGGHVREDCRRTFYSAVIVAGKAGGQASVGARPAVDAKGLGVRGLGEVGKKGAIGAEILPGTSVNQSVDQPISHAARPRGSKVRGGQTDIFST